MKFTNELSVKYNLIELAGRKAQVNFCLLLLLSVISKTKNFQVHVQGWQLLKAIFRVIYTNGKK